MIERDTDLQIGTKPPCFIHDVSNSPLIKFINGDSLEILKSFSDNEFDLGLIDPPYGIDFNYNEYQDTEENLIEIINKAVPELRRVCKRVLIFGSHKKIWLYPKPDWMFSYSWNTTGSYGKLGVCQWQPILFYGEDIKGFGSINNVIKSDSVHISGGDGVGFRRLEKINHPCPKPKNIIKYLIARFSNENDNVLDCFMGSGTAGLMAWDMKRNFVGIEIDKLYFDEAKKRFKNFTQQQRLF
jgi:DNA modification methylase